MRNTSDKGKKKDQPVRLDMTFEEAMKKALNTPLPKKKTEPKKKGKER